MVRICRKGLLFASLLLIPAISFAQKKNTSNNVTALKADFILKAASNISLPESDKDSLFRIGLIGRDREVAELFEELKTKSPELFISNKQVKVHFFRRSKNIIPVDILYVNGECKIRISNIHKSQKKRPYIIITENFPFGTSMLNFTINKNNNLYFSLHDEVAKSKGVMVDSALLNDPERIYNHNTWEQIVNATSKKLEVEILKTNLQKEIIKEQTKEIVVQQDKIQTQSKIILIVAILLSIILLLTISLVFVYTKKLQIHKLLEIKNKEVIESIQYAGLIQKALLPTFEQISDSFKDGFVFTRAKDIVSGDFYWHTKYDDYDVIAVVDSSGHGVPGAFMSIMGSELLKHTTEGMDPENPGKVLQYIDIDIVRSFKNKIGEGVEGLDIALVTYNRQTKALHFSGANRHLVLIRNGEIRILDATRNSIGGIFTKEPKVFATSKVETMPGDCFYMFTDGFVDQFGGERGKKYSRKRLHQFLQTNYLLEMKLQKDMLEEELNNWMGAEEQVDDICVVGVRV